MLKVKVAVAVPDLMGCNPFQQERCMTLYVVVDIGFNETIPVFGNGYIDVGSVCEKFPS